MKTWIYVALGILFVSLAFYSTTHISLMGRWIITDDKIYGILIILGIILYVGWLINKYILRKL